MRSLNKGREMRTEPEKKSIKDLIDLYRNKMLTANPEYQRGVVWSAQQQKKLIDSVMRGYPLPLIYLHHIKKTVAGMQREDLEVIDGQQRITALYQFAEGAFKLFDPIKDDKEAKFPAFLKTQPCPWGGKDFGSLSDELRTRFLDTVLMVTKIETDEPNEVRDLFVRLQSGLPLNAQEARDAWPGQFTEFVLWLGGKPELPRYQGQPFFTKLMGLNPRTDRGKTRQFAAQIAMVFLQRRERGNDFFSDINAAAINEFYYSHIDFDRSSATADRLVAILDKITDLCANGDRPKLKGHDAIHLVMLVDSLWDDYTRSWESNLSTALDKFQALLANAKNTKDLDRPSEAWLRYGQWTRVNSDRGERIAHRHIFYMEKMMEFLGSLQLKDPRRIFGDVEKEIIYFEANKKCSVCDAVVPWEEVEIHHLQEHSQGGQTELQNGALVHKSCHPKSALAVTALRKKLETKKQAAIDGINQLR